MTREINFIAWDHNDCEMLIPFDEGHGDWWWFDSDENGKPVVVIRDIKTCHVTLDQDYKITHHPEFPVMQYIGRKDINSKKIYNDFIVQCDLGIKHKVIFSNEWCAFMLIENKTDRQVVIYPEMKLEVIGNIHQNPELID